ncbi:MAG: hypothetical protein KC420_22600, partial [Myxococcales bacterium]|nr:hypothetical protein [Myxococcales bacterium]
EIISSILDISKIEADRLVVRATTFAVEPVLDEVRDTLTPLAARQKNTLLVHAAAGLGEIASDPTRLRQILLNVVGNALKFTHAGLVELLAAREGDVLTFVVRDTGIGMDAAELELIFEAFHQADLSSTRSYEGSGLGLTITRHLCRLLGGTIGVTSERGVGTTFTITLPATLPPAQERPD